MNRKIIKSFIDKNTLSSQNFEKSRKHCTDMEMKNVRIQEKIIELIESNLTGYEISKNWSFSIRTFTIKTGQTRSR